MAVRAGGRWRDLCLRRGGGRRPQLAEARDVDGLRPAVLVDDLHPDAVAGLVGGQRCGEVVDAPDRRQS